MVNKNIYFPNWIKKTIFLSENKILNLKQSFNSIMKLKILIKTIQMYLLKKGT